MTRNLGLVFLLNLVVAALVRPASADPVHDGLVSWWKMNEPSWSGVAGEVVDSQSENHCTAVGDATTDVGTISRAGVFDGNTGAEDFVSCGTGIQVSSAYTFEAWAYLEPEQEFGFWQRGGGTSGLEDFQIEFYVPGGGTRKPTIVHDRTYGMNYRMFQSDVIPTGEWAHVVLTWESSDWKLYVNGQEVGVASTGGTPADPPVGETTHFGLGNRQVPANGKLDEVRIYDRALTSEEVQHNYDYERGLLAWWRMDEPSWSGSTDEVTDSDGASHCAAVDGATTDAEAYLGRSGIFDASTAAQYVSCGGDIQVSSAYTFEAWAYLEPDEGFGFWQRGGGTWPLGISQIEFYVPDSGTRKPSIVHNRTYGMNYRMFESDSIPTGEWAHVVLTWESLDWKLYVNGQEVGVASTGGTPADPPIGQMTHIGLGHYQVPAEGKLDEVRIYDRALSRREVWERYELSDIARRPRVARVGGDLVPDSSVEEPLAPPYQWAYGNGGVRDGSMSRSGDWSIKLPASGSNPFTRTPATLVTPGTLYTTSFYVQSNQWPPPPVFIRVVEYHDEGGPPCSDVENISVLSWYRDAPADADLWNEVVGYYRARDAVTCIRVQVSRQDLDNVIGYPVGDIWLDDFYVGQQLGFEQDAGRKRTFASSRVRVDALGNVELLRGTTWEPFFPRVIYANNPTDDDPENDPEHPFNWYRYAEQGFNTVNKANEVYRAQKAKDAISSFEPDGLMVSFSIDAYMDSTKGLFGCLDTLACPSPPPGKLTLQEAIDALDTANLLDRVIIYNWDNENSFQYWDNAHYMISGLRTLDPEAPVYALNPQTGLARMYNNEYHVNVQDLTGSYVGDSVDNVGSARDGLPERLFVQDRLQDQSSPAWMAQLNSLDAASDPSGALRTRVYKALVVGSRGFSVYADCRPSGVCSDVPKVDDTDWWDELPNVRNEIEALIPLIREPHWTKWTLTVDASPDTIVWGTRYHHGYGYIILANMNLDSTSGDVTVTLSGADPGYTPTEIVDYFTGSVVATAVGDTFTVTIPPAGTAVYRFVP